MSVKSADTGNLKNHTHKLNELTSYPYKALILDISGYTGSILNIDPLPNRVQEDDYVVWVNGVTYEDLYDSTSPDTIDLTSTGLGGIIDGITFTAANARDFLIWGLANNANNGFDGFAVTHKPYSVYTGPAAAAKGATITFTGLTSAYQFTAGARAAVRNQETNGGATPAPQYQWNWGTITEIVSSTSIKIAMDNNAAYGVALTAATGGEILQWDKFRPWVVTASDQTLYTNNYRLIGELHTTAAGNISMAYRVDAPWRHSQLSNPSLFNSLTATGTFTIDIGRYHPIWSEAVSIYAQIQSTALERMLYTTSGGNWGSTRVQVVNVFNDNNITIVTNIYGQFSMNTNGANTTVQNFSAPAYYISGGMRE